MTDFIIREAKEYDWPEIIKLYKISQQKTGFPPVSVIAFNELESSLRSRKAIKRYVAMHQSKIIGHGLIEKLDKRGREHWLEFFATEELAKSIYIGGAFVDPKYFNNGIYTALFEKRLSAIGKLKMHPISATWVQNNHVCRVFEKFGGKKIGEISFNGSKMYAYEFL